MNIRNLIDELEYIAEESGDELEVRFASQPSWPFEYSINQIVPWTKEERVEAEYESALEEVGGCDDKDDLKEVREICRSNIEHEIEEGKVDCVYLVEGSQLGYLDGSAKEAVGW